jgi:hypothetical protein
MESLSILISSFLGFGLADEEKAARTCHYPFKYENRHYLKIPINVSPNQLKY